MNPNNKKRAILALIVLGVVVIAVSLFARRKDDDEQKYRLEAITRGDVATSVTATGTLSAVTTIQVGSQVSGVISRLYADFNSRVQKGQVLAELDPTPFEAQVEQRRADVVRAEVDARNAQTNYTRQRRLAEQGLASQADLDSMRANAEASAAQVRQSRAALTQSLTNLRYTRILSPIEGIVADRQYDVGQTVAASFQAPTLFTIAQDLTKMQVQADVDQSDIGRVKVGQVARFTVDAFPEEDFTGAIKELRLNATVNQNVVSYPAIIEVSNAEGRLRPKMTANVTIEVAKVKNVLRVPNAALRFRPEVKGEEGAQRSSGSGGGGGVERGATRMGERPGGLSGVSQGMSTGPRQTRGGRRAQTVYTLDGETPKPVELKTGISDGRFTEIVESSLKEGQQVISGTATARAQQTTGGPPGSQRPGGGAGGGGPRMGRF